MIHIGETKMKKHVAVALIACVCAGLVSANAPEASSEESRVVEALKQNAQDHGDALVAADIDRLDQMLADDWKAIGLSGRVVTKETVLANLKSGKDKLESFQLGPMDVQVFGNVAAIHGSVTEKRRWDGKDVSGQYLWMDLLEKRGDKWVIVRSAGAKVK
jgi:ketosteroid isomerase-like protein